MKLIISLCIGWLGLLLTSTATAQQCSWNGVSCTGMIAACTAAYNAQTCANAGGGVGGAGASCYWNGSSCTGSSYSCQSAYSAQACSSAGSSVNGLGGASASCYWNGSSCTGSSYSCQSAYSAQACSTAGSSSLGGIGGRSSCTWNGSSCTGASYTCNGAYSAQACAQVGSSSLGGSAGGTCYWNGSSCTGSSYSCQSAYSAQACQTAGSSVSGLGGTSGSCYWNGSSCTGSSYACQSAYSAQACSSAGSGLGGAGGFGGSTCTWNGSRCSGSSLACNSAYSAQACQSAGSSTAGFGGGVNCQQLPVSSCSQNPSCMQSGASCISRTGGLGGAFGGGTINPLLNGSSTPLVVELDGPVRFTSAAAQFDLIGGRTLSYLPKVGWIEPAAGFLALDLSSNGLVDDGRELFGSGTRLPNGHLASNGFEALAQYDVNHDGVIDAKDPVFSRLMVWRNVKRDGHAVAGELKALASYGIESLSLDFKQVAAVPRNSDAVVYASTYTVRDSTGKVTVKRLVDVYLRAVRDVVTSTFFHDAK